MDESQYHANPAVGSTDHKNILRSPRHYLAAKETPHEPTPAQIFGTLVHRAVLEPERFGSTVAAMPEFSGKGCVAAKALWLSEHEEFDIATQEQITAIHGIQASLKTHLTARALLNGGEREKSFFARDFDSGIDCKARVDLVRDNCLVDLKTCEDASPQGFARAVGNFLYYCQAAHYLEVVNESTGLNYQKFVLIAVEKKPPYALACYELDEAAIQAGHTLRRRALQTLSECQATGRFYDYPDQLNKITLAPWSLGLKD